jgi:hypothetical protein
MRLADCNRVKNQVVTIIMQPLERQHKNIEDALNNFIEMVLIFDREQNIDG